MKHYKTFDDIEYDLKRLRLEQQIAVEELKGIKGELKESLSPSNWAQTIFKHAFKFASFYLIKKIVR